MTGIDGEIRTTQVPSFGMYLINPPAPWKIKFSAFYWINLLALN